MAKMSEMDKITKLATTTKLRDWAKRPKCLEMAETKIVQTDQFAKNAQLCQICQDGQISQLAEVAKTTKRDLMAEKSEEPY